MSKALIEELRKENLCTHFVLPLLHLSKFSFVASNFVNCYLVEKDLIAVAVTEYQLVPNIALSLEEYQAVYRDSRGTYYLLYRIPDVWKADVELFRAGKFSKMSRDAKETIRKFSGLAFRMVNINRKTVTDYRLQALERNSGLKEMWERELDCSLDDTELLSIPDKTTYIDLSGLIPEG